MKTDARWNCLWQFTDSITQSYDTAINRASFLYICLSSSLAFSPLSLPICSIDSFRALPRDDTEIMRVSMP